MSAYRVIERGALLDQTKTYRYWLFRVIEPESRGQKLTGRVAWIMLNPSRADAFQDDPTIRRCLGFSYLFGYREIMVLNLFAFRSSNPKDLRWAPDPVGPDTDQWLRREIRSGMEVVAAWGAHGTYRNRDVEVRKLVVETGATLVHLGLTRGGAPRHPLYLPSETRRLPWNQK